MTEMQQASVSTFVRSNTAKKNKNKINNIYDRILLSQNITLLLYKHVCENRTERHPIDI